MSDQPKPRKDQIWREVDPRVNREVRVLMVEPLHGVKDVLIVCYQTSKSAWVQSKRFNGKSGGYKYVRDKP